MEENNWFYCIRESRVSWKGSTGLRTERYMGKTSLALMKQVTESFICPINIYTFKIFYLTNMFLIQKSSLLLTNPSLPFSEQHTKKPQL